MAGQICGSGGTACIAADQACAFVAGQLAADERAAIERRIEACARCRAVVGEAARRAGSELVRDGHGRTEAQRPAVTAALRGSSHRTPAAPARITGREATTPALLLDEHGDVIGAVRRAEPGQPAPPRTDAGLTPGEVVGRYVVERPLGAGGMGVVSLARDPELHRPVVIKLVHPEAGASEGGEDFEARLRREAQAMAQVSHANVVQIFDIGRRGDRVFLAMEFVDGQTLDHWLRERRRTTDEVIGVFRQAGAGLAAAHRAGLVHRDFKPSNVLVGRDGVVKVTDFGLARSVSASDAGGAGATRQLRVAARAAPHASGVHAVLTQANVVVGTPAYMAPEQAAGGAIDARTDQYALAVTLLDALIGQPASRRRIAPDAPAAIEIALDNARVAGPVRAAIVRALARDPAARFPAVDDLLRVLAPAAPPGRPRRVAVGIAGLAVCGAAAAAWFAFGRREPVPVCASAAPARWAAARDRVIAALSAGPRPFAGWDAARVAEAIDGAVDGLAAAETARCRGTPIAGREGEADCIARRTAALEAAVAAPGTPPPDDAWSLVHPIERCEPAASSTAELRGKLRTATAAQAREIADAAHRQGDERLAADASEVVGTIALAEGNTAAAAEAFRAMNAAGQQGASVVVQGRVLLHLIELRGATGEHELAADQRSALDALIGRYRDTPRDVLPAALVEGDAFRDLGDVAAAFSAWDRARGAANALGDADGRLAAAIGQARSMYALRFDLVGARTAARAAVDAGAAASPPARSAALGVLADLAIAAGDAPGAAEALDQASRLDPAQAAAVAGRVRAQRVRALQGDLDGALAGLAPGAGDDALAAARLGLARGRILLAANRTAEARAELDRALADLRGKPVALPIVERFELQLAASEAHLATTGDGQVARLAPLVAKLHARAPARARVAEIEAHGTPADQPRRRAELLQQALEILLEADAAPVRIAELRWQVARLCADGSDCRRLAAAAREAFLTAGRTAEVDEIDRWLADPTTTAPARRDPTGPQP
ncbi:MAG TPA: serine/threonine-protein kinase [Kofleriaceae bacterium]|nr:serine/threonine-protein kinase [Kofleriaceae bacterium]